MAMAEIGLSFQRKCDFKWGCPSPHVSADGPNLVIHWHQLNGLQFAFGRQKLDESSRSHGTGKAPEISIRGENLVDVFWPKHAARIFLKGFENVCTGNLKAAGLGHRGMWKQNEGALRFFCCMACSLSPLSEDQKEKNIVLVMPHGFSILTTASQ
jgi:hypothetical protein